MQLEGNKRLNKIKKLNYKKMKKQKARSGKFNGFLRKSVNVFSYYLLNFFFRKNRKRIS